MYRILHVDHDLNLPVQEKISLKNLREFTTDTIPSGKDVLKPGRLHLYNALVSDCRMPCKDRPGFLKQILKSGNTVPFTLVTGGCRAEIVIRVQNEGADRLWKGGAPDPQFSAGYRATMNRIPI